jgi:hypothetical protein
MKKNVEEDDLARYKILFMFSRDLFSERLYYIYSPSRYAKKNETAYRKIRYKGKNVEIELREPRGIDYSYKIGGKGIDIIIERCIGYEKSISRSTDKISAEDYEDIREIYDLTSDIEELRIVIKPIISMSDIDKIADWKSKEVGCILYEKIDLHPDIKERDIKDMFKHEHISLINVSDVQNVTYEQLGISIE